MGTSEPAQLRAIQAARDAVAAQKNLEKLIAALGGEVPELNQETT